MKKFTRLLAAFLCLALLLAGCSTGGSSQGDGKNLVVSQKADAVILDPHKTNDSASAIPMKQIYNTLVALDNDMQLIPSLATEWTQVDDLTWEFTLRQGVKFHNGDEMKASDVAFTFSRLINPETAAPAAFMLSTVDKIEVVDDYTVRLITKSEFASILYNLTHIACGILSEKAVTEGGEGYGQNPVGTGPFKFVEWKKNQSIVLEKNADYFLEPAQLDTLTFRIIPESATAISELNTGGVDMVLDVPAQYSNQFGEGSDLVLESFSTFETKYLAFDHRQQPFDDVRVRQAINYATNVEDLIKVVYEGNATPLTGPLPPKINGFNENLQAFSYDLEKAKSLLSEAGYPDGFTTTLYISDKEEDSKIATVMQSQLQAIGIQFDIQILEWGPYLNKTAEGVPMFLLGWTTVTADADNGMYSNFHSSAHGLQGNRIFYTNAEVDRLLDAGRSEFDPEKRAQMYKDAGAIIVEDAAWDFLTNRLYLVGMQSRVNNFFPSPTTIFEFYSVTVD